MKKTILTLSPIAFLIWSCILFSAQLAEAQNETPSSTIARAVGPFRWQGDRSEGVFVAETGSPGGQRYHSFSILQTTNPGLFPHVDLIDHIDAVDGTHKTGVLLHTGHGGSDKSTGMESFIHANDAQAQAAANARLAAYGAAGWDIAGADRELEVTQQTNGHYVIWMFDRAITNRAGGLASSKALVYIATCYGSLMCPAYVGKGARVAVGNVGKCSRTANRNRVRTFFRRMNGREGVPKRPVSAARQGLSLDATGNEATTLAPVVISVTAPCPIKDGDKVFFNFDTKCDRGIRPDIVGTNCTIEHEKWLTDVRLEGTCTAPPPPGAFNFSLRLKWQKTYSKNNTARLDGNTNPAGSNGHGPAHDDYVESFSCSDSKCAAFYWFDTYNCPYVVFTDSSKSKNAPITGWHWDFGDGKTSNSASPGHQYSSGGNYIVTLTIQTADGCVSNYTDTVTVGCIPDTTCSVSFSQDLSGCPNANFSINGFSGTGFIQSYAWDFGDGSTSNLPNPGHQYTRNNNYPVCLTITTTDGCEASYCEVVSVNCLSTCEANFMIDDSQCPTTAFIDQSTATHPDQIVAWHWDFGDGNTSNNTYPVHNFQSNGDHTVCLTIITADGCTSISCQTVSIGCYPYDCEAGFDIQYYPECPTVQFTDMSTANPGIVIDWHWDFGDGHTSMQPNPIHNFTAEQSYPVKLVITTSDGCKDSIVDYLLIDCPLDTNPDDTIAVDTIENIPPDTISDDSMFFGFSKINPQCPECTEEGYGLQVYPNPINTQAPTIRITLPENETIRLELYDVQGIRQHVLYNDKAKAGTLIIRPETFESLSDGIYLLRLNGEQIILTKRIALQR